MMGFPHLIVGGRESKGVFSFAKEKPSLSAQARREMQRAAPFCFLFQRKRNFAPHFIVGTGDKGGILFRKREYPLWNPQRKA